MTRKLLLTISLLLTGYCYGATYTLNLSFIDAVTNTPIASQDVRVRLITQDTLYNLTTNKEGKVSFSFDAEHFVKYHMYFPKSRYSAQTRERYLRNAKEISLSFAIYPNDNYVQETFKKESEELASLKESTKENRCLIENFDTTRFDTNGNSNFIDEHLQLPYWYGDYGFDVQFKVQATLDQHGNARLVEILESADPHLNKEIIRLVRLSYRKLGTCEANWKQTITFLVHIDHSTGME